MSSMYIFATAMWMQTARSKGICCKGRPAAQQMAFMGQRTTAQLHNTTVKHMRYCDWPTYRLVVLLLFVFAGDPMVRSQHLQQEAAPQGTAGNRQQQWQQC